MSTFADLTFSVIIPTYNEPERLANALVSLSCLDYPNEKVEIIVVDDATPQFSPAPLTALAQPFSLKFIQHTTNQGRARARNSGIQAATGEIIVFLDSDMTVKPNFLQIHAKFHQKQKDAVVIGHVHFGPEIPKTGLSHYIDRRGVDRLAANEPIPFKCFVTGNSSVRRENLATVGLFDEDFTAYGGEDLELGYRMHLNGLKFYYAADALSLHHHIRPLKSLCLLMYTYGRYSMPILLKKHPHLAQMLMLGFLEESLFSFKRLFWRTALLPLVYHPIAWLGRRANNRLLPDIGFDYLFWYNRTRGYLAALAEKD